MKTKLTYDQLRTLYLNDLSLPDTYHGRITPKVRRVGAWEAIQPMIKSGSAITIDPLGERDVWVWSDIHWGHKNIIKYTAPHRPFASWEDMNRALIDNYNAVVKPEDIVIFGGDIGFMSVDAINAILRSLPGYKIQIVGNHDMDRSGNLMELDFDERHLCLPIDVGGDLDTQILVSHYPIDNVPSGCVNYHGHIHQNVVPGNQHVNMCVEHTGCAPMLLRDSVRKHFARQ